MILPHEQHPPDEPITPRCADCPETTTERYTGPVGGPRGLCGHCAASWRLTADHRQDNYTRLEVEVAA